ncbi:hypothetical protein CXB51_008350 [Gossypium anomalum]|uniref:ABC transporter domain-containing protein n=1 Tax=Gossypium anomalum TaxID=47600 RepID=A0A8J5ZF13_9ROSI|nr:hypothetical protein CXB51_008350 [Gossypium anomalum]
MEGGNIYEASSSLRRSIGSGSSSIWRNNGVQIFSRSSRDEDDEEALKWAALEKLPTVARLRKGILASSQGGAHEINVLDIGWRERKALLERLIKVAEEDNDKFLFKLKNRIDRVGIDLPTIEVRFQRLNIEVQAYVGSDALPTVINFVTNIFESCLIEMGILSSRKKKLTILKDVSGIIKPGRMTLLLGPPSSGKTTLLLALAGKLDTALKCSGTVTYNGHEMNEFVPQRTAAYISQHDLHIGEMTVRETLAFSARCQGVGDRYDMLAELCQERKQANIKPDPDIDVFMKAAATEGQEANVITDYILKVLGLEICADTMVGDEMLRGISGGQKKRVTTGEMLVGPARALFMDEISTGLDSSTTFQIVNSLKQTVHILNGTAVISLLQPAPETYDLFDDIILISDGRIVYQGPREHVLSFFESMGFRCPERKGIADFLQEVTSRKDQMQYWARRDQPYRFVTTDEFAEAFQSFHVGLQLEDELRTPFEKTKSHPAALTTKKYGVGKWKLLKACVSREFLLMKRNSFVYIFKFIQLTFMAIVTMTLFLRTEMNRDSIAEGGIYMGVIFFGLIMVMFNGMSELSMTIAKLPVFYKQRDLLFFPAWAYALPSWILKIPITFVEVALWVFLTYYVIGFDPNVQRFFRQYFALVLANQMASGLFRFIAATARNMIVANTFGIRFARTFCIEWLCPITRHDKRHKELVDMGYWISPMMYGQTALMVNEFRGNQWSHSLPGSTEAAGIDVLKSRDFFQEPKWYWIGVGGIDWFHNIVQLFFTVALTYLNREYGFVYLKLIPLHNGELIFYILSNNHAAFGSSRAVIQNKRKAMNKTDGRSRGGSKKHLIESSSVTEATIGTIAIKKKGMVLPFEPQSITFDNVVYSVDMPQGVSGAFRPGVLTALMGVSGAGKPLLWMFPEEKQETFARVSGYCEQNDIHSPHVTVYESLLYSAWLRLPAEVKAENRKMFIEEVMELVELDPLSEEAYDAVELVANPSIIFMDEPTSGLDARAAAIVMRTVRRTRWTPEEQLYVLFISQLFLMKRGGQEIYVGPFGHHSKHLIKYFEGIQGVSKIKMDIIPRLGC